MNFSAAIDKPGLVLPQRHGLWASSYHLIHPVDGEDTLSYDSNGMPESYEVNIWPTPGQSLPITDGATGRQIDMRVGLGFHFLGVGAKGELHCYYPCQACDDAAATPATENCTECNYEHYYPSIVSAKVRNSTFNSAMDTNALAISKVKSLREERLEKNLIEGDCYVDDSNAKVNPFLSDAVADSGVEVLNGGAATSLSYAIGLLDEALSTCNNNAAGMIHSPIPVSSFWTAAGFLNSETHDYGDGMGSREVLRTRTRGNVVVAGPGYKDALGPNGAVAAGGTAWVYATSMVYLIWDKIHTTSDRGSFRNAITFKTNDTIVGAEQLIGAFYDPNCNYAVLVDLADVV